MLGFFPVFGIPYTDLRHPPVGFFGSERTIIYILLFRCIAGEFHLFVTSL